MESETYMQRCIQLGLCGLGHVAPNPMVGCVIVHHDRIIGEGYHAEFGQPHAEVNAINSVIDKSLLHEATLYVSLEPCSHFGKTPPCTNLIIKNKIPHVVIGNVDPFEKVNGSGIVLLEKAGIGVTKNILETECHELNKRFFTYHIKKRPYIILKWAQSADGYFAPANNKKITWLSNEYSRTLVHLWRKQEQAIIIGTNTALIDNPNLTVRHVTGKNPLRILIDKDLKVPEDFQIFNTEAPTLVFTSLPEQKRNNIEFCEIDFEKNILPQIATGLYERQIQSVIVEGGARLLNEFIKLNLWDEARVFTSNENLGNGLNAPALDSTIFESHHLSNNSLNYFRNDSE